MINEQSLAVGFRLRKNCSANEGLCSTASHLTPPTRMAEGEAELRCAFTSASYNVNKNANGLGERKWSFVLSSMDGQSGVLYTPRWQPCCLFCCLLRRDLSHHTSHRTSHTRLTHVSRTFRLSHTCLTLICGSPLTLVCGWVPGKLEEEQGSTKAV